MKERRYDIDWLRVIVTLTVFLFHCTRFFQSRIRDDEFKSLMNRFDPTGVIG